MVDVALQDRIAQASQEFYERFGRPITREELAAWMGLPDNVLGVTRTLESSGIIPQVPSDAELNAALARFHDLEGRAPFDINELYEAMGWQGRPDIPFQPELWQGYAGDPPKKVGDPPKKVVEGTAAPRPTLDSMAAWLAGEASQTLPGRYGTYSTELATSPYLQSASPAARTVASQWFDPISSQYLMTAAPESLGGYGGWGRAEGTGLPTGSTFQEYVGGEPGVPQWSSAEGWLDQPTNTTFSPWTSGQYKTRFDEMNLGNLDWTDQGGLGYRDGSGLTPAEQSANLGFLNALSMQEAQQMASSAAQAGLNPIAARSMRPVLNTAFARFERENPAVGAGEFLRQFGTQYTQDPRSVWGGFA